MTKYRVPLAIAFLLSVLIWSQDSFATLIFDNGPVDQTRATWNDGHPVFTIYDDFVLSSPTEITGLTFSIFTTSMSNYVQTFVSIFDGISTTANPVIAEFSVVGTLTSNGLTTTNVNVPLGFDVDIQGLSLLLGAGTYFLGISTETVSGTASIGSGPGSIQTIGPGLFQAFGASPASGGVQHVGDHMAFQIISNPVPEPATMLLLGTGLFGLAGFRRKFKKA